MRLHRKALLAACVLALVPPVWTAPAMARAAVTVDFGNIAFAYQDGYWDRDHHWHRWHNTSERNRYRAAYAQHYFAKSHTRVHGSGWRDNDRYWDQNGH